MEITAGEIADLVCGTLDGDPGTLIHGPSRIEDATKGTISFLSNPKYESYMYSTNASAVLVHKDFSPVMEINPSLIRVEDVPASVATLFEHFSSRLKQSKPHFISSQAYIDPQVCIPENVTIDRFTVVEAGAKIGEGSVIHPQVFIGENVHIGHNTIIHAGVKIYHGCIIGDNCEVHSNTVIGSDGFGYRRNDDGSYVKIPHIGNVIIENEVEIGSNTVIDRASLGSTIIRQGVKLDNLIQIAHNVEVGASTAMAAQVGVAGSTKIGKNCVIGGQTGVIGHIQVADGSMIQAKSGVAGNIKQEGKKWYGYPAIDYNKYLKSYAHFKSLPTLATKLKELEKEIQALRSLANTNYPLNEANEQKNDC